MTKRIVLFGGTFDPVHNGHLIVARSVAEQLALERITFVPARQGPHKGPVGTPCRDRLAMLQLAIEGEEIFDLCADEINRSGPSYTVDTLTALKSRHGPGMELSWVIGADMLSDLPQWRRVADVLALAEIIVAVRPPWEAKLEEIFSGLRSALGRKAADRLAGSVVRTPLIDISSTMIRRRASRGESIRFLTPEPVRAYILERGLYATSGG